MREIDRANGKREGGGNKGTREREGARERVKVFREGVREESLTTVSTEEKKSREKRPKSIKNGNVVQTVIRQQNTFKLTQFDGYTMTKSASDAINMKMF